MLINRYCALRLKRRASPARRSKPVHAKINDAANQVENFQSCSSRRMTNATATQSFSKNGLRLKRPAAKMPANTMGASWEKP
jgi:hypothetical protein